MTCLEAPACAGRLLQRFNRGRSRTGSASLPLLLTTVATARPEAAGTVFAQVSGHGRVSGTHTLDITGQATSVRFLHSVADMR